MAGRGKGGKGLGKGGPKFMYPTKEASISPKREREDDGGWTSVGMTPRDDLPSPDQLNNVFECPPAPKRARSEISQLDSESKASRELFPDEEKRSETSQFNLSLENVGEFITKQSKKIEEEKTEIITNQSNEENDRKKQLDILAIYLHDCGYTKKEIIQVSKSSCFN